MGQNDDEPVRAEIYRQVYSHLKERAELDQNFRDIDYPRGGAFRWTLTLSDFQRQVIQFENQAIDMVNVGVNTISESDQ